jgi:hypothetical protein
MIFSIFTPPLTLKGRRWRRGLENKGKKVGIKQ